MTFSIARAAAFPVLAIALLPGVLPSAEDVPPGAIRFTARNLIMTAHGEFERWHIQRVSVDEQNPERSVVEVLVDLASVDTGIERRDEHLRTADFFDVERFPTALVTLENFRLRDSNPPEHLTADVTLHLHGVTRRFPMEFSIIDRGARRIEGQVTLRRTDFGVGGPVRRWNPVSVRDEVVVQVEATVPPADGKAQPR